MLCPVRPSGPTSGWTRPTWHITEPSAGPGPALEGLSPRRPFSSFRGVLLGQRSGLTGRGRGGLWASQPRRGQGPCRAWPAMGGHAARNREQTAELALRAWPWLQSANHLSAPEALVKSRWPGRVFSRHPRGRWRPRLHGDTSPCITAANVVRKPLWDPPARKQKPARRGQPSGPAQGGPARSRCLPARSCSCTCRAVLTEAGG